MLQRSQLLLIGEEKEGFEPKKGEDVPPGVTKELLWNLWDIVSKQGELLGKICGLKQNQLCVELSDFRNNGLGGSAGMSIARATGTGVMTLGAFFKLANGVAVIWGKDLEIEEIQNTIIDIDEILTQTGELDQGVRMPIIDTEAPSDIKHSIAFLRIDPTATVFIPPGIDAKAVLDEFDQPELLDIFQFGESHFICYKDYTKEIVQDMHLRMGTLKEMGYTLESIAILSPDALVELRDKVQKIIAEKMNADLHSIKYPVALNFPEGKNQVQLVFPG